MSNRVKISFSKIQLKLLFALGAIVLAFGFSVYTQHFSDDLIAREKQSIEFYADVYNYYLKSPGASTLDFWFFIERLNKTMPIPVIMTNEKDEPIDNINIEIDSSLSPESKESILKRKAMDMGKDYEPIAIQGYNRKNFT